MVLEEYFCEQQISGDERAIAVDERDFSGFFGREKMKVSG